MLFRCPRLVPVPALDPGSGVSAPAPVSVPAVAGAPFRSVSMSRLVLGTDLVLTWSVRACGERQYFDVERLVFEARSGTGDRLGDLAVLDADAPGPVVAAVLTQAAQHARTLFGGSPAGGGRS